jgi:DNA helicase-2/ATP-dependent DNA helicase PcrA
MKPHHPDLTAVFNDAYRSLNPSQRLAVDTIEGPVMVIAGPGTGKTQILTLRIVNILRCTDTKPENILALTFTNAGAHAMRSRLRTFIGAAAYRVPIHTFHSFAEVLINQYPESYPRIIGGTPASDLEIVSIIEDILQDPQFVLLRPNGRPDLYIRPITRAISDLKKEGYDPDMFAQYVRKQEEELADIPRYHEKGPHKGKVRSEYQKAEKQQNKNRELLALYRGYEAALRAAHLYDFDDMVLETVRALQHDESMRLLVQETYQYVLADEQQDVNGSQNQILALITEFHPSPNLFVVGDEKQAIYRFQGASLENFLHFERRYADATIISLTDNYRSSQGILDLAQTVVATDDAKLAALRIPLLATTTDVPRIERVPFAHQASEDAWVVAMVQQLLAEGVPAAEIAILTRTNRQVEFYTTLLRGQAVAVAPSADSDLLEHPLFLALQRLITATAEPGNDEVLMELLHDAYWQLAPGDLVQLLAARSRTYPLSALIAEAETVPGLQKPEAVLKIHATLQEARVRMVTEAPQQVIAFLLSASGLLAAAMAHDPLVDGGVIRRFYDEVEALTLRTPTLSMAGVVRAFAQRRSYRLSLSSPLVSPVTEAVAVMTAHKSKGLEFTAVIMPDVTDAVWGGGGGGKAVFQLPNAAAPDADAEAADDVRLFYVALTRAKRTLLLSYAHLSRDGKERFAAAVLELLPLPEVAAPIDVVTEEAALRTLSPGTPVPISCDVLQTALSTHGLSATSLNNYFESPWTYLYRNVLRVPAPKDFSLHFGSVLHSVIDASVRHRKASQEVTASFIKTELERALDQLPLSTEEYTRMHERGLETLVAYLPHVPTAPEQRTEVSMQAFLPTGDARFPEVLLKGMLDRLDMAPDGTVLRVVDYKSGKPKTRGQIEGTTKDSNGNYKRQLLFYALLLSLQSDERLHCRTMTISFLESFTYGGLREETFVITDEEIAAIRQDVIRVALEIAHGTFLNAPCDPEECQYCELVAKLRFDPTSR